MTEELTREELEKKVSELEHVIRVLKEDLIHDSLTGLKTRKYFNEEAKKFYDSAVYLPLVARREWFGVKHVSFIFFDIDHFKVVNDTFGHKIGDAVLKAVADKISNGVRTSDIVARWGGEEILVALVGATVDEATKKADDIRRDVESMMFNGLADMRVTVSAGISTSETDLPFEEAIDRADKALYGAKNSGRNKVVSFQK
jgi:two-component system cell cycle response regulator